jgi:hypothetical protein
VRARRARARERLSSYREPASRNPQAVHRKTCWRSCARAPIRLLPIRAPRQVVLRTSSRLAPSHPTKPCDSAGEKTRDASNRCLPPIRTACTRTSRVPGSLSQLSLRGRPTESKAPCSMTGDPNVSRRPGPLRRIDIERVPQGCMPAAVRAWACSSHDADVIEPLTPLSRPSKTPTPRPLSRALLPGHAVSFWELGHGSEGTRTAKTTTIAVS